MNVYRNPLPSPKNPSEGTGVGEEKSAVSIHSKDGCNCKDKNQKQQKDGATEEDSLICGAKEDDDERTQIQQQLPYTYNSSPSPSELSSSSTTTIKKIHEHCCGIIAAMSLRSPDKNVQKILHYDGPYFILRCSMKEFPRSVLVQRQGCLAIRNLVSRLYTTNENNSSVINNTATSDGNNKNIKRQILEDHGGKEILISAAKIGGCVDEAYAALRDLNCPGVSLMRLTPDQGDGDDNSSRKGLRPIRMFGEVKNHNFRPVYD